MKIVSNNFFSKQYENVFTDVCTRQTCQYKPFMFPEFLYHIARNFAGFSSQTTCVFFQQTIYQRLRIVTLQRFTYEGEVFIIKIKFNDHICLTHEFIDMLNSDVKGSFYERMTTIFCISWNTLLKTQRCTSVKLVNEIL